MAPFVNFGLTALLAAASVVNAQDKPTKPLINPLMHLNMDTFARYLPPMGHNRVEDWSNEHIVRFCRGETVNRGMNPWDVESFNVFYNDCDAPWIMCRHRGSNVSKQQMIETFGRLPLGVREHVRHIGVWPDLGGLAGFMNGQNIGFSQGSFNLGVMIHESMHAVDYSAFRHIGVPLSLTQSWKNAYNQDSAVPAENSYNNFVEHFADIAIHSVWDRNVPGGTPAVAPHWRAVGNTMDYLLWAFGDDNLKTGGKSRCGYRWDNDPAVGKNNRRDVMDLPDTSIRIESIFVDRNGTDTEVDDVTGGLFNPERR
ncbi:hypothetical protein B0I35DRAFT_489586 [Stachybotrys elegans]|uniref:Conidiation-specific protein 13 n=1 Tax=Stachybotrys elegans TaxID=80388 RepID=A0A8K0WN63_9HYPO|nr:hypothetical protein B0I35DRAFT_489586 [Stachybotrys elegans]